jgi:hypothetical protein
MLQLKVDWFKKRCSLTGREKSVSAVVGDRKHHSCDNESALETDSDFVDDRALNPFLVKKDLAIIFDCDCYDSSRLKYGTILLQRTLATVLRRWTTNSLRRLR